MSLSSLNDLDLLIATQPTCDPVVDAAFQKALNELAGHFHGKEETGNPLSNHLVCILNASLRGHPSSDSVKLDMIRSSSWVMNPI